MRHLFVFVALALLLPVLAACGPHIDLYHSPIVAKSSEPVTFTATMRYNPSPATVNILVNAAQVKTCMNVAADQTCVFKGGPYAAYKGTTVSYAANATTVVNNTPYTTTSGYYYFAVTDNNYNWSLPAIPARSTGTSTQKIDFIFHRAGDYTSLDTFIDDVEYKIMNVYQKQELVKDLVHMDMFNFYVYTKPGQSNSCGTVHKDTATDIPWRNVDAVLHVADFQDCTSGSHFSAEGPTNTKAFLHESGHAVWGLADEYDGCYTYYFEPPVEPNIFHDESTCRSEQTAKNRDPYVCWKFTSCQGGWWGIHQLDGKTVMQTGMVGDLWGVEGAERVSYVFTSAPPLKRDESLPNGVVVVNLVYQDGEWQPGPDGVQVLPCQAPNPHLAGSAQAPFVQVLDVQRDTIYTQSFYLDPRIVLWEPREPGMGPPLAPFDPNGPSYLAETSIYVAVPLMRDAQTFEFYESAATREAGQAPAVSIPLGDAIRSYERALPAMEQAACQQPIYKPDALR